MDGIHPVKNRKVILIVQTETLQIKKVHSTSDMAPYLDAIDIVKKSPMRYVRTQTKLA